MPKCLIRDALWGVAAVVFIIYLVVAMFMPKDIFEKMSAIGTMVAAVTAVIGIPFAGYQLYLSREAHRQQAEAEKKQALIERGDFILRIDTRLDQFHSIYDPLTYDGKWNDDPNGGPGKTSDTQWGRVASYMGLFERLQIFIEQGTVDVHVAKNLYKSRVEGLVNNAQIRTKWLTDDEHNTGWTRFIKLCDTLNIEIPDLPPERRAQLIAMVVDNQA